MIQTHEIQHVNEINRNDIQNFFGFPGLFEIIFFNGLALSGPAISETVRWWIALIKRK